MTAKSHEDNDPKFQLIKMGNIIILTCSKCVATQMITGFIPMVGTILGYFL